MRAVRFGSYSIAATLAGIPTLSRRKSMTRYFGAVPPPRWRTLNSPRLLRPAHFFLWRKSRFSGFLPLLNSSNVETVCHRRPGDVGLYALTGMATQLQIADCRLPIAATYCVVLKSEI